ncbi:hypothetical protein CBER1_05664 [Cercospora berteroae]|uniref:J domain-containing protein n=1 Tax=Cercospora berteroae TaxID=357750 RepID=A0A2S6C5K6_9PEZI|nr:hypothetical protein CBER1_05664 [Cercospora berteroae]
MARSSSARRRLGTARGADLYDILHVPQDASAQVITASYHALETKMREQDLAYDEPTDAEREVKSKESDKVEHHEFPLRDTALTLPQLRKAFEVLSSPLERSRYDAAVLRYQGVRGDHWTPSKENREGEQRVRQAVRGDFWTPSKDSREGEQQARPPTRGDFWAPLRDTRQGDSWVPARDGRDWPTPPKRTEDGMGNR